MNPRYLIGIVLVCACAAGAFAWWDMRAPQNAAAKQETSTGAATTTAIIAATSPAAATSTPSEPKTLDERIAAMSLDEKIADLLILHTPGTDPATLASYVQHYHPAGLIFMEDNIPYTKTELALETRAIQQTSSLPYLIATDEEGCTVKRLASDTFLCAPQLGTAPVASTTDAFHKRGELLRSVGINLNFGIIADITSDPQSFIYPRVFSGDPQVAGARVAAAVSASNGLTLSTLKHFPGHGETEQNSHLTIPSTSVSKATWERTDAVPFKDGIEAGADVLMFGHLIYSSVDSTPASLSAKWHQIATGEMGFHGLSITDDMFMLQESGISTYADPVQNAVRALNAGNDLLLYVNNHGPATNMDVDALVQGIAAAVHSGQLPESRINDALRAVLSARKGLSP